jgi:hypothetical protein
VVIFEVLEGDAPERPAPAPRAPHTPDGPAEPTAPAPPEPPDDVSRHGPGQGGRLPALLLIAAVLLVGALALWWGIAR